MIINSYLDTYFEKLEEIHSNYEMEVEKNK